ncbi:MAG: enoyl-CoA hydratase, partial [Alphaproteobacteria bacterium]|nr:enoyl-CoA hydratase [Alphaproteobacteria bacterium]
MEATMSLAEAVDAGAAVLLEERDAHGVLRLMLNRPAARNALSMELMAALLDALCRAGDDPAIRVVVIAGSGAGFCPGHDLKEMRSDPRREAYARTFDRCGEMMQAIVRLPKPVIAEVHGIATAAGCQLVATCDLAVASEDATFATSGINVGLFCSTPMVALSRAIGRKAAMGMLLTGDFIDAATAQTLGLINRVVPRGELRAATDALARKIAEKSMAAIALGKTTFYRQVEMDLSAAYAYTSEVMTTNMQAADAEEGIDAFIAKRKP